LALCASKFSRHAPAFTRLVADVLSLAPEHYIAKPIDFAKLLAALR
jgi:hypothetical protein